jgi:hypothetical protein
MDVDYSEDEEGDSYHSNHIFAANGLASSAPPNFFSSTSHFQQTFRSSNVSSVIAPSIVEHMNGGPAVKRGARYAPPSPPKRRNYFAGGRSGSLLSSGGW